MELWNRNLSKTFRIIPDENEYVTIKKWEKKHVILKDIS